MLETERFSHQDAWNVAMEILEKYDQKTKGQEVNRHAPDGGRITDHEDPAGTLDINVKKGIGVRIVVDGVLIFQYLMDGKKDDSWLIRKENTVRRFQCSSMDVWKTNEETHEYEGLKADTSLAICGGGVPIIIGGEVRGAIAVSGLVHYEDHELIVEALESLRRKGILR